MKQTGYNFRIARTIKALRKMRVLTQNEMAEALCVNRSSYSKLENGEVAITVECLKIVSKILETSVFQIHVMVEADILIDFKLTCLSEILIRYTNLIVKLGDEPVLNKSELEFIIKKIKSFHEE
jgi:transcriptional regulator with XRE-family HTH domain